MARDRAGRGQHQVLAARPDHGGELRRPPDRVALDVAVAGRRRPRRPHSPGAVQGRPADGRRTRLREHRARAGGGARRGDRRDRLDLRPAHLRRPGAAPQHGLAPPRRLVLGGRRERRRPDLHRQPRPAPGRPRRPDGKPLPGLRHGRLRRPHAGVRPRDRRLADDLLLTRRHRRRQRDRRQHSGRRPHHAAGGVAGRRARLRRPDGRDEVDLPHHPAGRRVRRRLLAERVVALQRPLQRLVVHGRRRGARLRLPADGNAVERLVRRHAARQQPVRGEHRRRRRGDRRADVALPGDPPRALGLGLPHRAEPARHRPSTDGPSRRSRR